MVYPAKVQVCYPDLKEEPKAYIAEGVQKGDHFIAEGVHPPGEMVRTAKVIVPYIELKVQ